MSAAGRPSVADLVRAGHFHSVNGRLEEAEHDFLEAVARDPSSAIAHNNVGWTREAHGDDGAAESHYRRALEIDEGLTIARKNLGPLLIRLGRRAEGVEVLAGLVGTDAYGLDWLEGRIEEALGRRDLTDAGELAAASAELHWGSRAGWRVGSERAVPQRLSCPVTVWKLRHDADQFEYLVRKGIVDGLDSTIAEYRALASDLASRGPEERLSLHDDRCAAIRETYGRMTHVRAAPRVPRALSSSWDCAAAESAYLGHPLGLVVIDDFLCPQALESLREFCLESTVWSGSRYTNGRLGAFFRDGFDCPLLLQVAEEVRDGLPRVIGDHYQLRQMWGFKSGPLLPADATTHADFAAVNVNFWITPDDANLDPTSGGMVIYDVDAPLSWNFEMYNARPDVIVPFLRRQGSQAIEIPYRENRAVIFNSDLFHGTSAVHFRPEYDSRRVNITMLYGERARDVHNPRLARPEPAHRSVATTRAWRSAAFARTRRRPV